MLFDFVGYQRINHPYSELEYYVSQNSNISWSNSSQPPSLILCNLILALFIKDMAFTIS
jgi:hypothetical protein